MARTPTRGRDRQIAGILRSLNLDHIEELVDYTEAQLMELPKVGKELVGRVKERLAIKGLRLKPVPIKTTAPKLPPKTKPPAKRKPAEEEFKPVRVHQALRYLAELPDIGDPELAEITRLARRWLKDHAG